MQQTPTASTRIPDLAQQLLSLELELACLHGDRRLRDAGVAEQVREDLLPILLERWKVVRVMGPVQIMSMRHEVERELHDWLERERTPYPSKQAKQGIIIRIWHCILRS